MQDLSELIPNLSALPDETIDRPPGKEPKAGTKQNIDFSLTPL
jgi:hypothetical protein